MLHYPIETDVLVFLRHIVASLQPFAQAHSVALTFESDKEALSLSYHPETVASDVMQLLCRVVTFTPQNQSVKLRAALHDEDSAFYMAYLAIFRRVVAVWIFLLWSVIPSKTTKSSVIGSLQTKCF